VNLTQGEYDSVNLTQQHTKLLLFFSLHFSRSHTYTRCLSRSLALSLSRSCSLRSTPTHTHTHPHIQREAKMAMHTNLLTVALIARKSLFLAVEVS